MQVGKIIPKPLKYPLIAFYIFLRCAFRGKPAREIRVNMAGVLPRAGSGAIVHGGKIKLLAIRERFGDTWKKFNIAYFVSSGLPFAPALWMKIYKKFEVTRIWNQNGVAYPAWAGDSTERINSLLKSIHQADYVVYQTNFTKKCSDKFLGTYNGPSEILVNPVDTKYFLPSRNPLPEEPLVIIMSGHHFESKERLDISLNAVRTLKQKGINIKLLVIGNTQEIPEEDWIEIVGKFNQKDAPKLYQKAHILLHLKNLDPCPTIVLEALSCGLPVVGLANGGMPELVNSESGILIPAPEDFDKFHYPTPDEVVEAIMNIRENLPQFSQEARMQALKFDKQKWLDRHEQIFHELIK